MSDAEQQAAGAVADQPLVLHTQYIKDLSFENPNAPRVFTMLQQQAPQMEVAIDVSASKLQDRIYEVALKMSANPTVEGRAVFVIELDYCGLVSIKEGVQPEQVRPLLFIEAPSMIFPFARRIIADATRDGGFPPLLINPINFAELFRQKQYDVEDAAGGAAQAPASEAPQAPSDAEASSDAEAKA